jgi:hypothetical protein
VEAHDLPRRRLALLAGVAALAAAPAGAAAQSPLQGLPPGPAPQIGAPPATTPASPTPASPSSSNGDISVRAEIAIVAGAFALLSGIAYVIMRDARRAAPVKRREFATGGGAPARNERLRRQRARAKQARRQRKRNR